MSDFISLHTLTEATYLASAAFLGYHALRAFVLSVFFAVELLVHQAQKAKAAGFSLLAVVSALAQTVLQSFDVAAPLLVMASGIGMVIANLGMLAFVPSLSLFEVLSTEVVTVSIIWRAMEAYVQHVERKRDAIRHDLIKPAAQPRKNG